MFDLPKKKYVTSSYAKFQIHSTRVWRALDFMNEYACHMWQFPLQMLHLRNQPNPETQIPGYQFKWHAPPEFRNIGNWKNDVRGTELRVARGNFGWRAADPPPPRAQSKSQFESVPQDTEESESLDLVDFRGTASSVETVVWRCHLHFLCVKYEDVPYISSYEERSRNHECICMSHMKMSRAFSICHIRKCHVHLWYFTYKDFTYLYRSFSAKVTYI